VYAINNQNHIESEENENRMKNHFDRHSPQPQQQHQQYQNQQAPIGGPSQGHDGIATMVRPIKTTSPPVTNTLSNEDDSYLDGGFDSQEEQYSQQHHQQHFEDNQEQATTDHSPTDQSYLPILQRPEYYTSPSIQELHSMNEMELQHLTEFSIFHKNFGSVKWLDEVDVTYTNLDEIISILQGSFEVYPDEMNNKPSPGTKLNKPAEITLRGCWPTKKRPILSTTFDSYEKKLKEMENVQFILYDRTNGDWIFRVEGF